MHAFAIATAYLVRRKESWFSVLALAVGVAGMVCIFSIGKGFEAEFRKRFELLLPDLMVGLKGTGNADTNDLERLLVKIESADEIVAASPVLYAHALLLARDKMRPDGTWAIRSMEVGVKGIDFERESRVTGLSEFLSEGGAVFREDALHLEGPAPLIIGATLAEELSSRKTGHGNEADLEAPLQLVGANLRSGSAWRMPARVSESYEVGMRMMEQWQTFTALESLCEYSGRAPGEVRVVHVRLASLDPETLSAAKAHIESAVKAYGWSGCSFSTKIEMLGRSYIETMPTFVRVTVIVMMLMVVMAGFSIVATVTMTVIQKKRDIGILIALGSSRKAIAAAFLVYGMLIGIAGSATGTLFSVILLWKLDLLERAVLNPMGIRMAQNTYFGSAPWQWSWEALAAAVVLSVATGLVAAVIPAWKAARLDPVEAIRGQ